MILARLLLLAVIALMVLPAQADDDDDQERARTALERGEIRSLAEVLAVVARHAPGDVVDVELDNDDDRWVYEVKVLTAAGRRVEVEIDAASLDVLDVD